MAGGQPDYDATGRDLTPSGLGRAFDVSPAGLV